MALHHAEGATLEQLCRHAINPCCCGPLQFLQAVVDLAGGDRCIEGSSRWNRLPGQSSFSS